MIGKIISVSELGVEILTDGTGVAERDMLLHDSRRGKTPF